MITAKAAAGSSGSWGSAYDLSGFRNILGSVKGDECLRIELTPDEYNAFIAGKLIPYDPDSERIIFSARYYEEVVEIEADESDMDALRDCIAADVNHEKNRKREKYMWSAFLNISDALDGSFDRKVIHLASA